jgi:hypothetical protein
LAFDTISSQVDPMATTFQTSDSKLAYNCRKALRAGDHIALTITERGKPRQVAGRIVDVGLEPMATGELIWRITLV